MDLEDIYAKWNESKRENTVWYHLYVEPKKYNKLVNITKKNKTDKENTLMVISGKTEEGRGNTVVGYKDIQTPTYEISYNDILYNMKNTDSIL